MGILGVRSSSSGCRACGDEGGKQIVHLIRNTVELIAQAVAECQIRKNFVRVLEERAELRLAEAAGIIGRAISTLVKELRLSLRTDGAEKRPGHVLQRRIR